MLFVALHPAPSTPTPPTWTAPGYIIRQTEPSRFVLTDIASGRAYAFTTFQGAIDAAPARGTRH